MNVIYNLKLSVQKSTSKIKTSFVQIYAYLGLNVFFVAFRLSFEIKSLN